MKIVSPVDHAAEAAPLLDAGADELYGGYVPEKWEGRYSLLASINQRTFAGAQLCSFDELLEVIREVKARGRTFSLTLNAPFYIDRQIPLLLEVAERAVEAGVDGIILADPGLLRILVRRYPHLEFHASTLAHLSNSSAVRFYAGLGVRRAVLPRHLPLNEIRAITAALPQLRFDAFLLVGKCPNTEGLCTFHHSSPDRIWPCEIPYRIAPLRESATPVARSAMERQGSWSKTNRRHGCGLCAIPALMEMDLHGLKLVGRGAPTAQKVKNILLARDFIALAGREGDSAAYRRAARDAHRRRFGAACSSNVCYYPELCGEE